MQIPTKSGVRALAILGLAALSLLAGAVQASARTVPVYTYTGQYYDGTGSTAGTLAFRQRHRPSNQTAEKGYVVDPGRGTAPSRRFDREGNPLAFARSKEDVARMPSESKGRPETWQGRQLPDRHRRADISSSRQKRDQGISARRH